MDADQALREHLLRLLNWHDAHVTFDAAVKEVPPDVRGLQPPGLPYSLWQVLEHIRLAQRDILDFCRNPSYQAPDWPADYWPPDTAPPTPGAWDDSIAAIRADRLAIEQLVADPGLDLYATIPHGEGQTYLREILLVADHNAFHVGQLVAIRRMLGAWRRWR
jgi:uncharacterized damage-inducible protein DinB